MSRVHNDQKWCNSSKYDSSIIRASKMLRIHTENEDYHKASSLSSWLFIKYNLSYKTYRHKSKARRDELRKEYVMDTGADIRTQQQRNWDDWDDTMDIIARPAVGFGTDGTPLGIGWDD